MKEHPHAWALRLIANGVPVEEFEVKLRNWENWGAANYAWFAYPEQWQVRRKQKMRRIGEHTFPAPMTEAPENRANYFIADFGDSVKATWVNDDFDKEYLAKGIAHSSKEAAEAHSKALAAIVRGEPI